MPETINIYCDESCHLENDEQKIMLVSCTYCAKDKVRKISEEIRALKQKHKIWRFAEIKWTKVSKSKEAFYLELLDYFLNNPNLKFRTIIIDKTQLDHSEFGQTHNEWYYKMIYLLVSYIIDKETSLDYNIYADKKENSYQVKREVKHTKECLQAHYKKEFILQNIQSHQSEIMQINDFLQGAISFYNRKLYKIEGYNKTKRAIVEKLKLELNIDLSSTNYYEKFNIFRWGKF
jgi:hypothetical protein